MEPNSELLQILEGGFPRCRLLSLSELGGGVSARAVVAELALEDGSSRRVVVRRPRAEGPDATRSSSAREYALLAWCRQFDIPAPEPCFIDESRGAIVLEYVEGDVDLSPAGPPSRFTQMAAELARIHRAPIGAELESLGRRYERVARDVLASPVDLDSSLNEAELRSHLRELWPWPQHNPDVVLHGDYWPANILWRDGQLLAVLDWEEAVLGDPLGDVAVARLDLLWAFDEAAMQSFTDSYREQTHLDWTNLARWDLWAALRPMGRLAVWAPPYALPPLCRPDITEATLERGHRRFVEQALASLSAERAGAAP